MNIIIFIQKQKRKRYDVSWKMRKCSFCFHKNIVRNQISNASNLLQNINEKTIKLLLFLPIFKMYELIKFKNFKNIKSLFLQCLPLKI